MVELGVLTYDQTAFLLIGAILVEALLLYVGYGAIQSVLGPRILSYLTQ